MIKQINTENVYVCGDTHGQWNIISNKLERYKIINSIIIHVGDFGVGFLNENTEIQLLNEFNNDLKESNNIIYAIRGNHDYPKYFDDTWSNKFSNINLISDYSILTINDIDWLLIGGAISIDRHYRVNSALMGNKVAYWHNEKLTLEHVQKDMLKQISDEYSIRYVVTHTCPTICFPHNDISNVKNSHGPLVEKFAQYDTALKVDLNTERKICDEILFIIAINNKIEKWFYGHYHNSITEEHYGIEFNLLNINEIKLVEL